MRGRGWRYARRKSKWRLNSCQAYDVVTIVIILVGLPVCGILADVAISAYFDTFCNFGNFGTCGNLGNFDNLGNYVFVPLLVCSFCSFRGCAPHYRSAGMLNPVRKRPRGRFP